MGGRTGLGAGAVRRFLFALAILLAGFLAGRAQAQTGYIAFGDSITAGVGDDDLRTEKGYPPRLEALLLGAGINAAVDNYGVGGEDTVQGLARLPGVLNEAAISGDVLI